MIYKTYISICLVPDDYNNDNNDDDDDVYNNDDDDGDNAVFLDWNDIQDLQIYLSGTR